MTNPDPKITLYQHLVLKFPSLNNAKQMAPLLRDFHKTRETNPELWDLKHQFWARLLMEGLKYDNSLIFEGGLVQEKYCRVYDVEESAWCVPLGMEKIVRQMEQRAMLSEMEEFCKVYDVKKEKGFGEWVVTNLVVNPVSWFWGAEQKKEKQLHEKNFVNMELLRKEVNKIVKHVYDSKTTEFDLVLCPEEVNQLLHGRSAKEIYLIINYMQQEAPSTLIPMINGEYGLRFSSDRGNTLCAINDTDRSIAQVKQTLLVTEKQRGELEEKIEQAKVNVRKNIKNRKKAKFELKRKNLLEKALERRLNTLSNLEKIMDAIQTAQTDKEVLFAMSSGARTLQTITRDLDDAEVTLEQVAATLEEYKDIQEVMDASYVSDPTDEEEINTEIAELSKQVQKEDQVSSEQPSGIDFIPEDSLIPISLISSSNKCLQSIKPTMEAELNKVSQDANKLPAYLQKYNKDLKKHMKLSQMKRRKLSDEQYFGKLESMMEQVEKQASNSPALQQIAKILKDELSELTQVGKEEEDNQSQDKVAELA